MDMDVVGEMKEEVVNDKNETIDDPLPLSKDLFEQTQDFGDIQLDVFEVQEMLVVFLL